MTIDKEVVRSAAAGRWLEILTAAGVPLDTLDGRHHPCPKCGGTDRFRLIDANAGAAMCNQCFHEGNGDGFATVAWIRGIGFADAVAWTADFLNLQIPSQDGNGKAAPDVDVIAAVAAAKGMSLDGFKRFRPRVASRKGIAVARVAAYGPDGKPCTHFDLATDFRDSQLRKGKFKYKGGVGVFLADAKLPSPGDRVICGEGFKDLAAILGLGWGGRAVGFPGKELPKGFAGLFAGCDVTIVAHRDQPGEEGAERSAARLAGVAKSIRIAHLPGELKKSGGMDARDVIKQLGPDALIRAIKEAAEWKPPATGVTLEVANAEVFDDGERREVTPLEMNEIVTRIYDRTRPDQETDGWPRRVGESLFVHERPHGIHWLRTCDHFFGWLGSVAGTVSWHKGAGCHSKTEVYSRLQQVAPRHDAVTERPHFPPLAGWYYACEPPGRGDGRTLRGLIDFFNPSTLADVDLILSYFVTPFWGGPSGSRPAFLITGKNRGDGKTTLAGIAGRLAGGVYDFSKGENYDRIKTRLLTRQANEKRVAVIDNIKSNRFSWAELESLITAKEISGHQMYVGESQRPNILTWAMTANGPSVSKDISQRVIVIKLAKPIRESEGQSEEAAFLSWETRINAYIDERRDALIADIAAFYDRPPQRMARWTRWELWSKAVLARLPDPSETLAVIEERQRDIDADEDEGADIEEFFEKEIVKAGYDPAVDTVHIPNYLAVQWYSRATSTRISPTAMTRAIRQAEEEGLLKKVRINPSHKTGRGVLWVGDTLDNIHYGLIDKLEQYRSLHGRCDWEL